RNLFQSQWSALLYYLRLFVWPDALVVDRLDFPWARSLRDVQAWGSLLALVPPGVAAWRPSRGRLAFPWSPSLRDVQAWGSLLALVALGVVAWRLSRVRLAFGFCALWVVITLAPGSGVLPLGEAVNEHPPYL